MRASRATFRSRYLVNADHDAPRIPKFEIPTSIRRQRGPEKSSDDVGRGYSGEFRSAPTDHSMCGLQNKAREDCLKRSAPF
jgi:hypothetical protein